MNQKEFMEGKEFISQALFNHGEKFYNSYQLLKGTTKETNLPSLVCLAFSIEIFFKSLRTRVNYKKVETYTEGFVMHQCNDKSIVFGGHNLLKLFNGLGSNMKVDIRNRFKKEFNRNIEEDLSNVCSGFVDWRYMYEGKTSVIHLSAIQNVGEFMYLYVRQKLEKNADANIERP